MAFIGWNKEQLDTLIRFNKSIQKAAEALTMGIRKSDETEDNSGPVWVETFEASYMINVRIDCNKLYELEKKLRDVCEPYLIQDADTDRIVITSDFMEHAMVLLQGEEVRCPECNELPDWNWDYIDGAGQVVVQLYHDTVCDFECKTQAYEDPNTAYAEWIDLVERRKAELEKGRLNTIEKLKNEIEAIESQIRALGGQV